MCQNDPNLAAYSLDEEEWIYLGKVHSLLLEFLEFEVMTKTISSSVRYPTLNRAMSVYNVLIDKLEDS